MPGGRAVPWLAGAVILTAVGAGLGLAIQGVVDGLEGPPELLSYDVGWGNATEETTEVEATLEVRNPNDVDLRVGPVSAWADVDGARVEVASGPAQELPGERVSRVNLTLEADNRRIVDAVGTHLLGGERSPVAAGLAAGLGAGPLRTTVSAGGEAAVSTSLGEHASAALLGSPLACPDDGGHPHPRDPPDRAHRLHVPCLEEASHRWTPGPDGDPVLESRLEVRNPNGFPVDAGPRSAQLRLHGIPVAEGSVTDPVRIPGEGTGEVGVRLALDGDALQEWWPRHVEGDCETSPATLALVLGFETPAGPAEIAVEAPWAHDVTTDLLC